MVRIFKVRRKHSCGAYTIKLSMAVKVSQGQMLYYWFICKLQKMKTPGATTMPLGLSTNNRLGWTCSILTKRKLNLHFKCKTWVEVEKSDKHTSLSMAAAKRFVKLVLGWMDFCICWHGDVSFVRVGTFFLDQPAKSLDEMNKMKLIKNAVLGCSSHFTSKCRTTFYQ